MNIEKISLTGRVTNYERQIADMKQKLSVIDKRLKIAYNYKDNLYNDMGLADKNIQDLQNEYHAMFNLLSDATDDMKKFFDIYTQNLY